MILDNFIDINWKLIGDRLVADWNNILDNLLPSMLYIVSIIFTTNESVLLFYRLTLAPSAVNLLPN